MSGQGDNISAFDGHATGVTIDYLSVESFVPVNGENAVNHDDGANWTVEHNTVEDNTSSGSASGPNYPRRRGPGHGSGDVYEYDCLTHNGEYGMNAAGTGTTFSYNEVSYNGAADFPDTVGCGCSGGIKYWTSTNATVEDNYIHDNYNVGLWFDTNNTGALVQANYVSRNWAEGIIYEISYNADITDNTLTELSIPRRWSSSIESTGGGHLEPGPYAASRPGGCHNLEHRHGLRPRGGATAADRAGNRAVDEITLPEGTATEPGLDSEPPRAAEPTALFSRADRERGLDSSVAKPSPGGTGAGAAWRRRHARRPPST